MGPTVSDDSTLAKSYFSSQAESIFYNGVMLDWVYIKNEELRELGRRRSLSSVVPHQEFFILFTTFPGPHYCYPQRLV